MTDWTIDKTKALYRLDDWGQGYFDIAENGHLIVKPSHLDSAGCIEVTEVIAEAKKQGLSLPLLIRFSDILSAQVHKLQSAFSTAIKTADYAGSYQVVYPIKVNQQKYVVDEIVKSAQAVGLECGSKAELLAVLALVKSKQGIVICNGYKDKEYIRLALLGQRLGHKVVIVIEKEYEVIPIIQQAEILGIKPLIGIRVKLASIGAGYWQNTGGVKSKFGLTASQVISILALFKKMNVQHSLCLLHFHLGSQLPDIEDIKRGAIEAAHFYADIMQQGFAIKWMDVGGGLAVDYEGDKSTAFCSRNYSEIDYANAIVQSLKKVCKQKKIKMPDIISESGRALTAHHAMLVTDVVHRESYHNQILDRTIQSEAKLLLELQALSEQVAQEDPDVAYHEATGIMQQAYEAYAAGEVNLHERAFMESLYISICVNVRQRLDVNNVSQHKILQALDDTLADRYICNFSLFQSLPDAWAIDQIFPVMPIECLTKRPTRRAVLSDITCDSDGRIDFYVDEHGVETSVALHDYHDGEEYRLGIFLVGAYQEILGDMHNLFGDTDAINVSLDESAGIKINHIQKGDNVEAVLRYVHINIEHILDQYKEKLQQSEITADSMQQTLKEFEQGLKAYTYLNER